MEVREKIFNLDSLQCKYLSKSSGEALNGDIGLSIDR